jgi:hypothetical protein
VQAGDASNHISTKLRYGIHLNIDVELGVFVSRGQALLHAECGDPTVWRLNNTVNHYQITFFGKSASSSVLPRSNIYKLSIGSTLFTCRCQHRDTRYRTLSTLGKSTDSYVQQLRATKGGRSNAGGTSMNASFLSISAAALLLPIKFSFCLDPLGDLSLKLHSDILSRYDKGRHPPLVSNAISKFRFPSRGGQKTQGCRSRSTTCPHQIGRFQQFRWPTL